MVLVVSFRLRHVRSPRAHALFRAESLLNTVLFAGFPGLVSKLWSLMTTTTSTEASTTGMTPCWPSPTSARLWWVLALVSVPDSIHYAILPGVHRDELLHDPHVADDVAPGEARPWWDMTGVEPAAP